LPSQCLVCHAWPCREALCEGCWQRFNQPVQRCTGCALALPGLDTATARCGQCLKHPPPWQHAWAWRDYGYPWNQLLTQWKFAQQPALARHWAHWMQQDPALQTCWQQAQVIIPIPLSVQRLRERGYNPAAQLAKYLGRSQAALWCLQRTRDTPAQSGLSRKQRLRNLRNAFEVPQAQRQYIEGKTVLLIDDVMTTGATFTMASHCLLQAGASSVQVLCATRTP
jgi:ComF family protein